LLWRLGLRQSSPELSRRLATALERVRRESQRLQPCVGQGRSAVQEGRASGQQGAEWHPFFRVRTMRRLHAGVGYHINVSPYGRCARQLLILTTNAPK
jgi:hypothetical protein